MLVRLPAFWQSGRKRYAIFRFFCARQVIFPAASCRMTVAGETGRACPADFAREGFSKEYLALIFGTCPAASSLPGMGPGADSCDGTAAAFRLNPEAEGQIDWRREEIEVKLGIVGLPNVGKSTLFNSLTKAGAESANYPFCTIDPNVGVVAVPDQRLKLLGDLYHSAKVTPAVIEFVDIAGLVKGASKGEGLGNQFLANIRECDAIVHVVRCFDDSNVVHVDGSVDPQRDIETISLELIFADLEVLERRMSRVSKGARNDKEQAQDLLLLQKLKEHLESGKPAISFPIEGEKAETLFRDLNLLTAKPVIYAANVAEDDAADDGASSPYVAKVREIARESGSEVFVVCAQIEEEISELDDDEKQMFLEDMGLKESGLDKLIRASYSLLGLMSFLTAGEKETRAWTIRKGTKAPQAAGKIHSDFERGFIRAEVVNYRDLLDAGSLTAAREKGIVRLEGKEYVVQDGDVILFRFNV